MKITLEPVSNLSIKSVGKTVQLRWSAVDNAEGYLIYRKAADESKMSYRYIVTSPGFDDTVEGSGYYFYRVYPYRTVNDKRVLGESDQYVYTQVR